MRAPDALGIREAGYAPDPHDYGLDIDGSRHAEYEADWYRWRAVRRDAQLTEPERAAWLDALRWRLGIPFEVDGQTAWLRIAMEDPPGTVRRCECGRTMVARRPPPSAGYVARYVVWEREGRLARWWRERRQPSPVPVPGES